MLPRFVFWAGLAAYPLAGFAQATAPAPAFYLGLNGSFLTSAPFSSRYTTASPLGVGLTAGVSLTPHLALQVSPGLHWDHQTYTNAYSPVAGMPSNSYSTQDIRATFWSVPVLARYTFTAPASRLHVDALGGGLLLYTASRSVLTYTTAGQLTDQRESSYRTTDFFLSLGPGLRYSLTPALDLYGTALLNYHLNSTIVNDFSDRLLLNYQLGVLYAFK